MERKHIAVDLRCLADSQWSGVAVYTSQMLQKISTSPEASAFEWSGVVSGRTSLASRPTFPKIIQFDRRPNRLLNLAAVLNIPPRHRFYDEAEIVWQPNPMFLHPPKQARIVTIHDLSFIHFPAFFSRHTRNWYLRWVRQWLETKHDRTALVAISEHVKKDLLECFPHWQGSVIVQSQPPPTLRLQSTPADDRGKTILFVGTLGPRKNISVLLVAFARFRERHPDGKLILVGKATPWFKRLSLPLGVEVRGYASNEERDALYKKAWCVVYPSWYEGYGLPPLEAMAFGVPAIASNLSAIPEAVGEAAILIDPYRGAEEIEAALNLLASDATAYREYQTKGQERISFLHEQFSLDSFFGLCRDLA